MKKNEREQYTKTLASEHTCYVLITCGKPGDDGNMDVEMSYEGDPALVAYLIHGAQNILEEQSEEQHCYGS